MISRLKARALLHECTGRDIWSVDHCQQRGIPELWIEELSDCFESGLGSELTTIYVDEQRTNQYHGVHDLALAFRLAELLGVDSEQISSMVLGREAQVRALKEAVDEV